MGVCYGTYSEIIPGAQLCGGPALLRMQASSSGISQPGSASTLWMALFAEAAAMLPLKRGWAVRLAFEALAPLGRPTFAIRDVGPVYRPKEWSGQVSLGAEVLF